MPYEPSDYLPTISKYEQYQLEDMEKMQAQLWDDLKDEKKAEVFIDENIGNPERRMATIFSKIANATNDREKISAFNYIEGMISYYVKTAAEDGVS